MKAGDRPARAKWRDAYELRKAGRSWTEVGSVMGLSATTVQAYCRSAINVLGLPEIPLPEKPKPMAVITLAPAAPAVVDPEAAITALREAAKAAGVKPGIVQALVNRLRAGDPNVAKDAVKRLAGKELREVIEDKLSMILHYVDEVSISQAGLKDLAIAGGVFFDKVQLLNNKPTQIIDFTSRMQMAQLLPKMLAEAKRRGLTLEGEAQRVES